jgi:hypothetical protein
MKINLESPFTEFKNSSGSEIEFEIKNIFNFNSNVGKSNEKSYLRSRLYVAISV